MITSLAIIVLTLIIGLFGFVLVHSPGRPAPLVHADGTLVAGGVSERVFVDINGSRQGMIVQSTDLGNPVLLFLHGGPGMPTFFLNNAYPTGLEKVFTLVWWEQRGAGMSFDAKLSPKTLTVAQMIEDTITVTNYLRARFKQEKIYLLGHSWGSFLGIQVAAKAPALFHAYIGMGQISYQLRSEVLAHDYALDAYQRRGDAQMVHRLKDAPVTMEAGTSAAWMGLRDTAMHQLGVGTTKDMKSVIDGIFLPIWREPAYTLEQKISIWRGKAWSRRLLWQEVLRTDLTSVVVQLDIPVYFFIGHHDYTANHNLAGEYFKKIKSPLKGYYTFYHSAHSPVFEEPALATKIMRQDVLQQGISLANAEYND